MKVLNIKVSIWDAGYKNERKLEVDFMKIIEAIGQVSNYQSKFPIASQIIEGDWLEIRHQAASELAEELRLLPRKIQHQGLESLVKQIQAELLTIKQDQLVQFITEFKEIEIIQASMTIYCGADDPSLITETVGLQPSRTAKKGDFWPTHKLKQRKTQVTVSIWSIHSTLADFDPIEDHIKQILDVCRPYKSKLIETASKYGGPRMGIGAHLYSANPQLELDAKTLKELGEYGARLWLDMYTFVEPYIEDALGNKREE